MNCPFCEPDLDRVAFRASLTLGIWDRYPVADGHALVVPKRHVSRWADLEPAERIDLLDGVERMRELLQEKFAPGGFTIGINDGPVAGQTVPHLHAHIIPRHLGDVEDPRGGIRWVIPTRARYW